MTVQLAGAALAFLAVAAVPAPVSTPTYTCSNDSFVVDGRPVGVALCLADNAVPKRSSDGKRTIVTITERLASNDQYFSRDVSLDFLAGAELSRTIDDLPLERIGILKQLHLTIGYSPGSVRLEHALLIPGAIALK
jgi:hypothetical protein